MARKKIRSLSQDLKAALEKCGQLELQRRRSYRKFVESIQNLQPLEKAESWLKYIARNADIYGDQEAVVYLISRGHECANEVRSTVSMWKIAEKEAIEQCIRGAHEVNLDTNTSRYVGGMSFNEATDIINRSHYELPNFWSGYDHQELTIGATMLRTVEWCKIGGFDEWWLRYAKAQYEETSQGGIDPVPASYFIFNMARSDYAIQLMHRSLLRLLEAIEIPEYRQAYPWRRWRWTDPPIAVDQFAYAASIVFADARFRPNNSNTELIAKALDVLQKRQGSDGAWRCWGDQDIPSVATTAMVIHALAMKKPRGWEIAVSGARDWLLSIQGRSGCWIDSACPDSVYLTVLVLDALELASGGSKTTFSLSKSLGHERDNASQTLEANSVNKIKALFLTANPANTVKLSLDEQIRSITEKIRGAEYRDALDLDSAWAVRADDLLQYLNEHKPHIVHFSGHGSYTGQILVIGNEGQAVPISTKALQSLFKTLKDNVRVVILDACYSSAQAEAISEIIDCAIGMDGAIGEVSATVFTASFYRAIGFGRSVQEAFDQGIAALLLENIREESTPKLLLKAGVDPSQIYLINRTNQ